MVRLSERLLDRLLSMTTGNGTPEGHVRKALGGDPWRIRRAAARWYTIWSGDPQRLCRLRVLLLPQNGLDLSAEEELALAQAQLQRPNWVPDARHLADARQKLRKAVSRRL